MNVSQKPALQNAVAITSYLTAFAALFFALSPIIVSYPGVPPVVATIVGIVGAVLTVLGYQAHSAQVRTAELNAAAFSSPAATPLAPLVPLTSVPAPGAAPIP